MTPARSIALAIMLTTAGVSLAADIDADLDLLLGRLALDDDVNWHPLDDQPSIGFMTTWGDREWPVRIAADLHYTQDDQSLTGVELDGRTLELALGVRRSFFLFRKVHPYAGAGLVAVDAEVESSGFGQGASADDLGVGFWLGTGMRWQLKSGFTLGAAVRWSDVRITLPFDVGGDVDGEAGGFRYGILLGWTLSKPREQIPVWRRKL